jgi:hypothetical protein
VGRASPTPSRPVRLAFLAGAVHLAFDGLASRVEATTPPYLLLRHAPEVFRDILDPVGVAIAASLVQGAISALIGAAFEERPAGRRALPLALALWGLWILSGGLLELVYLSAPWPVALGSLAAGLPRAAAVAWLVDRMMPAPDGAPPSPPPAPPAPAGGERDGLSSGSGGAA